MIINNYGMKECNNRKEMLSNIVRSIIDNKGYKSFSVYRSEMCHLLKEYGDVIFTQVIIDNGFIRQMWDNGIYAEALYLSAMLEYLSDTTEGIKYEIPLSIKGKRLKEPLFPQDVLLLDALITGSNAKQRAWDECSNDACGRYFTKYNIVERSIRDAV